MADNNKYYQQAQSQYDTTYNSKVQALKNQLAQNQQNLDQQKGGINSNYDYQIQKQNLANKLNKNTVSNTMLGRGLANSSIAVSGIAEQDAKNARLIGDINRNRTADLNDIEAQKALLAQNMNNTLSQMAIDREDEIRKLAYQLEDRDWEKNYKQQGLDLQKQAQVYEQQYKDAMLKMQQEKQKFDMGYQNRYLEMQQQAQLAEQNYKNSVLALQREQMNADNSYRQQALASDNYYKEQQLAWQKEQAQLKANANKTDALTKYSDTLGSILGGGYSASEKYNLLTGLYNQVDLYGNQNGVDTGSLKNSILDNYKKIMASNKYK